MPDPLTTAATVAATQIVKRADGLLSLLLSPAAKETGLYLRRRVKRKFARWEEAEKSRRLADHSIKTEATIERSGRKKAGGKALERQMPLIKEWVDGAEEVDPDEPVLGALWQKLLADILCGDPVESEMIRALKSISPSEAAILVRFADDTEDRKGPILTRFYSRYLITEDERDHYHLQLMSSKGIAQTSPAIWIQKITGPLIFDTLALILVSTNQTSVQFDNLCYLILAVFNAAFVLLILNSARQGRMTLWTLTWLGRTLLDYHCSMISTAQNADEKPVTADRFREGHRLKNAEPSVEIVIARRVSCVPAMKGVDGGNVNGGLVPFPIDFTSGLSAGSAGAGGDSLLSRIIRIESIQVAGQAVKSPAATRIVGGWAMQFLLFSLSAAATALFYERDRGIFHRILAGPVSRAQILWSKFIYGLCIGMLQLVTLFLAGRILFGIDVEHHIGFLLLVCAFAAAACTAFGMLLAAISPSPEAAAGFATFL